MPPPTPKPRRPFLAFPYPHFMALAPLDVWLRILFWPAAWCPPRYWLRLASVLFTSALATVLTLPERLLLQPILWLVGCRRGMRLRHKPGVVVILGYFRSGTTHLHYLLSCDPQFRTPAWCETLAPSGFLVSWSFLRIFLIPWIGSTRPQDDMALGPTWPAEDDFAQNNGAAASSLPWRFVVPSRHKHYSRFHFLEGLTPRELARWRFHQFAFCWKIARLAGRRAVLLKSPSHLARVPALLGTLGPENVKFIHISRPSRSVIESNVAMLRRMSIYGMQDPTPEPIARELITAEYIRSEQNYLRDVPSIPKGRIAEVRYEDLISDPVGQVKRLYAELGLTFSPEFERHAVAYLHSISDYRPATNQKDIAGDDDRERPELRDIESRFGHDKPGAPVQPLPANTDHRATRAQRAVFAACIAAAFAAIAWMCTAYFFRERFTYLVWPTGGLIGLAAIWTARVGSRRLGIIAAALTFLVFISVAIPVAFLEDYIHRERYHLPGGGLIPPKDWEWYHITAQARQGFFVGHNLFWGFMGVGTAYRFASRRYARPPATW